MKTSKNNAPRGASCLITQLLVAGVLFFGLGLLVHPLESLPDYATEPLLDPAGVLQVFPWVSHNFRELSGLHFPLWNPLSAMGEPHLANIQTAVFFPLYWPWYAAGGGEAAYGALLFFRLWLAAMLWFFFARKKLCSFAGALVVGSAYAFGGYGLWFMQLIDLNSQVLLPLLMLCFSSLAHKPSKTVFAGSSLLTCLAILGGHPEAAFITVFIALLYSVSALFADHGRPVAGEAVSRGRFKRLYLSPALLLASSLSLGVLLCSVSMLPFLNYLSRCWTMHGSGFGFFHLDPRAIVNLVAPGIHHMFSGMPREIPVEHMTKGPIEMLMLPYSETSAPGNLPGAGLVVCGLAILAITRLRRLPWQGAFFTGLLAALLGLTLGLPLFRLIALIPPFNLNSNFKFFFSEIHVCLAMLAGAGFDLIFLKSKRPRKKIWVFLALVAFFVSLIFQSNLVRPFVTLERPGKEEIQNLKALLKNEGVENRVQGIYGYWPPNRMSLHGIKDIRSSDALFYRPYVDLINRINGFSAEEALGYFYPSYYMRVSPERLSGREAGKLALTRLVSDSMWMPRGVVEQAVIKGSGVYGQSSPKADFFMLPRGEGSGSAGPARYPGLFLHPPARVSLPPFTKMSTGSSRKGRLHFIPAIKRRASSSDGALFQASIRDGQKTGLAYSCFFAPGSKRRMTPAAAPVLLEMSPDEVVELSTLPGPRNLRHSDWAGFAALSWRPDGCEPPPQPERSHPYVFKTPGLPWAHPEGSAKALRVDRKAGDRVLIDLAHAAGSTMVVHEAWYPGWKVEIDGKPGAIHIPGDKVSWRVRVQEGAKSALFTFEPLDFRIGLFAALASLLLFFAMLIWQMKRKAD